MVTRIKKTDLARDALYDKVNTMIDEVNTKIDNKDSLPSQTGNGGKFLTTDGTNASWGTVKQIEIKQDLTNPSTDTVPSTKAVSDESSRIVSIMNSQYSNLLSTLYPVGSIYIGTQATCPLATLIQGSVWQIVGTNRALWCGNGSNANTTIDAGLPNIGGNIYGNIGENQGQDGALYIWNQRAHNAWYGDKWVNRLNNIGFDASRSNGIYGRSTTVQPDAYIVNVWRRIS